MQVSLLVRNSRIMPGRSDAALRVRGLDVRIFLLADCDMSVERDTSDSHYTCRDIRSQTETLLSH